MKKLYLFGLALALGATPLFLNSCKKLVDDATETTESAEDATSDMVAYGVLSDMLIDIAELDPNFQSKNGSNLLPRELYYYVNDDSVFTDGDGIQIKFRYSEEDHINLDGDEPVGYLGQDVVTRWGSGYITINKPFNEVGSKITLELDNFTIKKDDVTCYFDDGKNGKEMTLVRESANNLKLSYSFSLDSKRPRKLKYRTIGSGEFFISQESAGAPGVADDKISVTGGSTNKNKSGKAYTTSITETLKRDINQTCSKTFTSGKMELKNDGSKFTIKVDFGDGSCDNEIEVDINGLKKTVVVN